MTRTKTLVDEHGIINEACRILPDDSHKIKFMEALGELEDNDSHRSRTFPKTRMHLVKGAKQKVYRADIDKISGWRLHLQLVEGKLYLRDIIEGQKHDNVLKVIKSKKIRYE